MHNSTYELMQDFANQYHPPGGSVLEVGSRDENGSYRPIFVGSPYVGIDWQDGPGVDVVVEGWDWTDLNPRLFDTIISGQALEHDGMFWLTLRNMAAALRPGGHMCIIVPGMFKVHRFPVDCYRFNPDAMYAFGAWMGLAVIEARAKPLDDTRSDTIGVFRNEN